MIYPKIYKKSFSKYFVDYLDLGLKLFLQMPTIY